MVSIRGHTTVALEAPIETSVDLLTLINELLGLLGVPQVVIPNLTQVLLLLFEIVALSWPNKAALVRYAEVFRLVVKHDRFTGTHCEARLVE